MAVDAPEVFVKAKIAIKTLEVHPQYRDDLIENGLLSFKDFAICKGLEKMRDVPGRLTVSVNMGEQFIYLKRHWKKGGDSMKSGPFFEAKTEWDNTRMLERLGIKVPTPLAYGLGRAANNSVSFYLSKGVEGVQSDRFLRDVQLSETEKKDFIDALASFAKNFHNKGFNHRDFYLCHFFVDRDEQGKFSFSLIDLQRVQKRQRFRYRWLIKDMGQMFYSLPDSFTQTDKLRLFKAYRGVEKLSLKDKKMMWDIDARVAAMEKRNGKYRV